MPVATLQPDRLFRALGDKTRLRLLCLLLQGELCVCDLTAALRVPQPTASRHLAYLRRAGLVTVRRQGVWHYYRLAPAATPLEAALHECLRQCGAAPRMSRDLRRLAACDSRCCE